MSFSAVPFYYANDLKRPTRHKQTTKITVFVYRYHDK